MEDTQPKLKKQYTLHFILNPSIAQEEIHGSREKVNEKIQALEGQIETSVCDQRINRLAYPIKKIASGFVCESVFIMNPEKIHPLNDSLKHADSVVRFMVELKVEPPKFKPAIRRRKIADTKKIDVVPESHEVTPSSGHAPEIGKEKPEKLNIEEIDKKLDEIIKNI